MYSIKARQLPKGALTPSLQILRSHNLVIEKHGNKQNKLSIEKYREEFLSGRVKPKLSQKDKAALASLTEDIKIGIVAHHIKMVQRVVNCFVRKFNVANPEDIASEAEYALVKALYAYTKENIYFSTFAHWVVTNTLKDYFRKNHNGLSPVSKAGIEISNCIEKYRTEQNGPISFDQAVRDLGLDEADIAEAVEAGRTAGVATAILQTSLLDAESGDELSQLAVVEDDSVDLELMEAFKTCPLSPLERAVMDAALNHWHGWMVDLGREFPHDDGRPRDRQHIRMVMMRARKKIQAHYENSKLTICRVAS